MTRILVVYGTTDGQTAKIGRRIESVLRERGAVVDVHEAGSAAPSPDGYDGVIVAASIHARGYQRNVRRWARTHAGTLNGMRTAFVTVCLGVLQHQPAVDAELARIRA
jgi:menaquinone-dependent protoporphyrinogen oxidase